MNEISLKAPAKINLTLDIVGRREDGYHLLRTIMQSVDLSDTVTVKKTGDGEIRLTISDSSLPTDRHNTAYKAAEVFFSALQKSCDGIAIDVQKWIPMQAGMGGGSADAAGVLKALNILYDNPFSIDELCDLGVKVGADVPFCVLGGAALATGIGEILEPIEGIDEKISIVICKPPVGISTAEAYGAIDQNLDKVTMANEKAILESLKNKDICGIGDNLQNAFEQALANEDIQKVICAMEDFSPVGCRMTGSGSAVFALFESEQEARDCAFGLADLGQVYICHPC